LQYGRYGFDFRVTSQTRSKLSQRTAQARGRFLSFHRAQPFQGWILPSLSVDSARHSPDFPPDFALLIGAKMEPSCTNLSLPRFASNQHALLHGSLQHVLHRRNPGSQSCGRGGWVRGCPSGSRFRELVRSEEVRIVSGALKVPGAFWDKLEGSCRRPPLPAFAAQGRVGTVGNCFPTDRSRAI
jgi:hypothetical protein